MIIPITESLFNSEKTPEIVKELVALNKGIVHTPTYFKAEIIISYFKNHSIKNEWINANPELVDIITKGVFKTTNIESLFENCRFNQPFRNSYEIYLRQQVLNPLSSARLVKPRL